MPERLKDYLARRDAALLNAANDPINEEWLLVVADWWQKLYDLQERDLAESAANDKTQ